MCLSILSLTAIRVIWKAAHGKHGRFEKTEIKKAPNSVHRDQKINIVTLESEL